MVAGLIRDVECVFVSAFGTGSVDRAAHCMKSSVTKAADLLGVTANEKGLGDEIRFVFGLVDIEVASWRLREHDDERALEGTEVEHETGEDWVHELEVSSLCLLS